MGTTVSNPKLTYKYFRAFNATVALPPSSRSPFCAPLGSGAGNLKVNMWQLNLKDLNILSFEYNLRQFVPIFTRDERQPQDTDAIIKFISSGRLAMPTTMR